MEGKGSGRSGVKDQIAVNKNIWGTEVKDQQVGVWVCGEGPVKEARGLFSTSSSRPSLSGQLALTWRRNKPALQRRGTQPCRFISTRPAGKGNGKRLTSLLFNGCDRTVKPFNLKAEKL